MVGRNWPGLGPESAALRSMLIGLGPYFAKCCPEPADVWQHSAEFAKGRPRREELEVCSLPRGMRRAMESRALPRLASLLRTPGCPLVCLRREVKEFMQALSIDLDDASNMFSLLDRNGDGTVDIVEFVMGMEKLRGEAKSSDIHFLIAQCGYITDLLKHQQVGHVWGICIGSVPQKAKSDDVGAAWTKSGLGAATFGGALGSQEPAPLRRDMQDAPIVVGLGARIWFPNHETNRATSRHLDLTQLTLGVPSRLGLVGGRKISANFGQTWPGIDQLWANFGQIWAELVPVLAQIRTRIGGI